MAHTSKQSDGHSPVDHGTTPEPAPASDSAVDDLPRRHLVVRFARPEDGSSDESEGAIAAFDGPGDAVDDERPFELDEDAADAGADVDAIDAFLHADGRDGTSTKRKRPSRTQRRQARRDEKAREAARAAETKATAKAAARKNAAEAKVERAERRQQRKARRGSRWSGAEIRLPNIGVGVGLVLAVVGLVGAVLVWHETRLGDLEGTDASSVESVAERFRDEPGTRSFSLTGEDGTRARVIVDASGQAFVFADRLPALPEDRTYQLWGATNQAVVSLGVLGPEPGVVPFQLPASVGSVSITDEVAGGSAARSSGSVVFAEVPG